MIPARQHNFTNNSPQIRTQTISAAKLQTRTEQGIGGLDGWGTSELGGIWTPDGPAARGCRDAPPGPRAVLSLPPPCSGVLGSAWCGQFGGTTNRGGQEREREGVGAAVAGGRVVDREGKGKKGSGAEERVNKWRPSPSEVASQAVTFSRFLAVLRTDRWRWLFYSCHHSTLSSSSFFFFFAGDIQFF